MLRFFSLIMLAFCTCSLPAAAAPRPVDSAFQQRLASDVNAYMLLRTSLRQAADFARSRPELFNPPKNRKNGLFTREDKLAIWTTWSGVLNSIAGLDSLRRDHRSFEQFNERERKSASFAIANAAFLAGYRHALEFIALAESNRDLDTILNEAVPELGIPAGTFGRFKFRFLNVAIASEFAALQVVSGAYGNGPAELRSPADEDRRVIWGMGKGKGTALTLKNALAIIQKTGFSAWFPLQKGISEWMGDTKVARKHRHLISAAQIEAMGKRLQPGDILFERHEWYLSNLGLPGFWTHVALYVGTPAERRTYFADAGVREWVKKEGVASGDLETLLQQRYPKAYAVATAPREEGHPPRIVEAISEGVSFTSLEFTGASDSIGVIRPRLSKRDKAQALLRAFHYSGRPYDFNFDFRTDSSLVCSELVYKAYEPGGGMKGVRFALSEVLGRTVSIPNGMVRQFDEQAGTPAAQADFVLFLDGFEKEKRAVESTPEEFRASWQRPNWHILIQDAPVEARK
jgi:hypothetical protein